MIYIYLSMKNYREQKGVTYTTISIKEKDKPLLILEEKNDIYCFLGNLNRADGLRKDNIPQIGNKIIEKIPQKLKNSLKNNEDFIIVVQHDIIIENFIWAKGQLQQKKLPQKIEFNSSPNRAHLKEQGIPFEEKIEKLSNELKESNIKKCYPNKGERLIVVISDEFASSTSNWEAEIKDSWQFEACTEDEEAINEMMERVKELNMSTWILSHDVIKKSVKERIKEIPYCIVYGFHHSENDKVYLAIKEKNVEKIYSLICTFILIFIKHRIAHIFLPLDIDLMGIKEVKEGQKDENKAIEYLKEVLQRKDGEYYRRKLAVLQYMVARVPNLQTNNLSVDGKAIIDLIDEGKREDKDIKNCWKKLLKICGLKLNNDKNDPFDNNNIILDNDSPILKFMCLLDSKIEKCKNNGCSIEDVEKILNYFKNQNWEIEGKKINSFRDWFCALMDCLEKLREKIE